MDRQLTIDALSEALEDEYRARAVYQKVIERFGAVRPFVNIVKAENRHVMALLAQFQRLGVTPPADKWKDRVQVPETLQQACADGVRAELENEALYTRLLDQVTDPQVRLVMERLQNASRLRHLPAFRRCIERYTAPQSE